MLLLVVAFCYSELSVASQHNQAVLALMAVEKVALTVFEAAAVAELLPAPVDA